MLSWLVALYKSMHRGTDMHQIHTLCDSIGNNEIDTEGAAAIGEALKTNTTLQTLE